MIKSYKDLLAWQKAMELVELVYTLTRAFPREEVFGLSTSLRRASVSIASKIAAGHEIGETREYLRHLAAAQATLSEVETQMEVAVRLGYVSETQNAQFAALASETGKIMNGLMNSMERHAIAR
ncbi:MAG TPA: four helix bundle protein [Bryobacteraceae bacterium]|nr:four helix bundle protein [Bryobacteraceae bacterium]